MKLCIEKSIAVLTAGIFLLCGCMPSILVNKKLDKKEGQPVIEYTLGTPVEMEDWVFLKKKVCDDLSYATEGFPMNVRQNIFKYSCIENDKYALGATLEQLQPGQIDQICAKLSAKGHNAKSEKIMTRTAEVAAVIGIAIITVILSKK